VSMRVRLEDARYQPVDAWWSRHGLAGPRGASAGHAAVIQVSMDSCDHVAGVGLVGVGPGAASFAFSGEVVFQAHLLIPILGGGIGSGLVPAILEGLDSGECRIRPTGEQGLVRARVLHGTVVR
jgi:hypothetical protein